jgi:hypothetical protein
MGKQADFILRLVNFEKEERALLATARRIVHRIDPDAKMFGDHLRIDFKNQVVHFDEQSGVTGSAMYAYLGGRAYHRLPFRAFTDTTAFVAEERERIAKRSAAEQEERQARERAVVEAMRRRVAEYDAAHPAAAEAPRE